jgi:glutamate racemase
MTAVHVGVFDSGFGGLTVLRALLPLIPGARYTYLGDTARLPYGAKSRQTIARYAVSSAKFLEDHGAEMLVIACNTASALAMDELRASTSLPVLGVIEPGAQAAREATSSGSALVLATQATVQSSAYLKALQAVGLEATQKACPLLVPLVEEGWIDHDVTEQVARIYLTEALADAAKAGLSPSTVLLGCTHYPLLRPLITRLLAELSPQPVTVIDSAETTAGKVAGMLHALPGPPSTNLTFYATDSTEKFQALGSRFLGQPLPEVKLLDLGG